MPFSRSGFEASEPSNTVSWSNSIHYINASTCAPHPAPLTRFPTFVTTANKHWFLIDCEPAWDPIGSSYSFRWTFSAVSTPYTELSSNPILLHLFVYNSIDIYMIFSLESSSSICKDRPRIHFNQYSPAYCHTVSVAQFLQLFDSSKPIIYFTVDFPQMYLNSRFSCLMWFLERLFI